MKNVTLVGAGIISIVGQSTIYAAAPPTVSEEEELVSASEVAPASIALPEPTDGSSNPVPKANPGLWIRTEDYPADALDARRVGRTSFRVAVDKRGFVVNCEILVSSGYQDLDDATCNLVSKRAIFEPALDPKGKPVKGYFQSNVRWQIPNVFPLPKIGVTTISFIVEADGSPSGCKFETTADLNGYDGCKTLQEFEPRLDENGNPIRVRVVNSNVTKIYRLKEEKAD